MNTRKLFRLLIVFGVLVTLLAFELQTAAAAPLPPVTIGPAEGSTIVIPTFSWAASAGAAKYGVEVGPQSDPNSVLWSAQTVNLSLTPNVASLPNAPLYWRVRAIDSGAVAGAWTGKINFTKAIPGPTLVSPADGSSSVIVPTFEWQTVQGAAYYKLELSLTNTFGAVEASYTTYNTQFTPVATLPHGLHYWRVSGVDADGQVGTPSTSRSFTKGIPAPMLVSPYDTQNIHIPVFEWLAVQGAAYYKLELSTASNFVPVELTLTTYNTKITPVDTFAHGTHYWRVSGVDADGNVGTPSAAWSFNKSIQAPDLVSPGVSASGSIPTFEWLAVEGAAYYKLELSTASNFTPVNLTLTTYNLRITPVTALALNSYYWRVSGVDAGGNVGANNWRIFTLTAPPAPSDLVPQLSTPADAETITTDPTYQWSRVTGADHYTLTVKTGPNFETDPTFSSVNTDYNSYTPAIATSPDAYPNGTYYWRIEAKTSGGSVISTSAARSFTKQEALPLVAPADGASGLTADPTFQWSQIVGAHHYTLTVSTRSDFLTTFDSPNTDYNSYTPAIATSPDAYPNGTYYWMVEAKTSTGTVIASSPGRSFTKQEALPLIAPSDGASGLTADPTFQWSQIVGAHHYTLTVSTRYDFLTTFDSLNTDYNSYTPAIATSPDAYPNGTYYWKVEAKTSSGTVIASSTSRSFTKGEALPLTAPANGAKLLADPTFQWSQIVGAHHYTLTVSTSPSFSTTYDSPNTDYNTYTPYSAAGRATYANGFYFWKVEAKTSGGTVIATSETRSFALGNTLFLPLIIR